MVKFLPNETQEQHDKRLAEAKAERKALKNPVRKAMKGVTGRRKLRALRKKSRELHV